MRRIFTKVSFFTLLSGLIITSCSNEVDTVDTVEIKAVSSKASIKKEIPQDLVIPNRFKIGHEDLTVRDFELRSVAANAVLPSECGPTPFLDVYIKYDNLLFYDFLAYWDGLSLDPYFMIFGDYPAINRIAARYENYNTDYFGVNGEYTQYVKNRVRSLENFWKMPNMISVRGQHSETLEDLDFIRYVYENYVEDPANGVLPLTEEEVDRLVGYAEYYNTASDQIPENPTLSLDGFATFDRKIVIGDGIVTILAETGVDPKVVWSSILAHEWAHQIQFLNYGVFNYPVLPFIGTPESTRMTELEADFLTGYYLTHKRGATYNWKRVEDVLTSFFNIGDCSFGNSGHHGTPLQRMEAARLGYKLALSAFKNGHILSQDEVHTSFVASLNDIVRAPTGGPNSPNIFQ